MASPQRRSRAQSVFVRRDDEVGAMTWSQRLKTRLKSILSRQAPVSEDGGGDEEFAQGERPKKQYRVEASRRIKGKLSLLWRIVTLNGCIPTPGNKTGVATGVNPNQSMAMYLHWMFRVNFFFLFVVMCVSFFALVILFAGFIAFAGRIDNECIRVGDNAYGAPGGNNFADAFSLSWTTMSTVGYGSTYPALGYQNTSPTNCFFINFICSLEALLGVLYSGFCGAILFGKVLRIQSHAQVIFSDPLLIRFGNGVMSEASAAAEESVDSDDDRLNIPCPVLEFRIVNRLFNEVGGEIMDASLNVVANSNAFDADPALHDALEESNHGTEDSSGIQTQQDSTYIGNANSDEYSDKGSSTRSYESSSHHPSLTRILDSLGNFGLSLSRHDHQTVDEDPSARFVNKHIFSKMTIEASEHPFFRRVWVARHVLDEHSPILKNKVRRQIRHNGGSWPEKLNNASAIRDCLQFNQILVSLTGISNISASDVYAQKIYDFIDVNVGYQFVNILYRSSDGSLGVDTDLINDVREQNGGGGEPLIIDD